MPFLPCILCQSPLDQRSSKRRKPYFVCNDCGLQLFVRRRLGIDRLLKLIKELEIQEIYSHASSAEFFRILSVVNEITATRAQIYRIENEAFIFFSREQAASRKALEQ